MEEAESLEETLNESIREAVTARSKGASSRVGKGGGGLDEDDEDLGDR